MAVDNKTGIGAVLTSKSERFSAPPKLSRADKTIVVLVRNPGVTSHSRHLISLSGYFPWDLNARWSPPDALHQRELLKISSWAPELAWTFLNQQNSFSTCRSALEKIIFRSSHSPVRGSKVCIVAMSPETVACRNNKTSGTVTVLLAC